jgi:iron complex outermembrane recepter protein
VNMVPRSAFERSRPTLNYSVYMMMKDSATDFGKSPAPLRRIESKVKPGFTLNLIRPVNQKFGFTFSANRATQWVPHDLIALGRRGADLVTNGAAFPDTTPDRPYLTDIEVTDDLRRNTTTSVGATFDYKLSPRDTLSLSTQYTYITVEHIGHRLSFFITGVRPGDFSPTHTHGAPGMGALQLTDVNSRYWLGSTSIATLTYRHNGTIWKAESGAGVSYNGQHNRDIARGILRNSTARRAGLTISYDDNFYLRPGRITVTDATGAAVDPYRLDNYVITTANYQDDNWLTYRTTLFGNLQRHFDVRHVPVTLKGGLDVRRLERDVAGPQVALTPAPAPNQNIPGNNHAGRFLDEQLSTRGLPYGFGTAQWVDNAKLYQYVLQNPGTFTSNENTVYRSRVTVSKWMAETVSAAYLRGDVAFFDRRLQFVGGVRAEQTNAEGHGPLTDPTLNFRRDASGNILRDAAGRPVLRVPTTDALGVSQLTFIERGSRTEKEYLRVLPNINAIYHVRENLKVQAAHYYSLGRPNFNQYAGGLTLPDTDQPRTDTTVITVNNAGIKAWTARSTKVRAEYFFEGVGTFSVGAYLRDFENFFGTTTFRATPAFLQLYDLDPALYEGYNVATNYNIPGKVRTSGVEVAYRQALTFLPRWARGVAVFANGSVQRLEGDASANFNTSFIPKSGSWGISLTRPKYSVKANWNYRGEQRRAAVTGRGIEPGTFTYSTPRLYLDVTADYYFHRRLGLFAGFRNINNVFEDTGVYGPSTPSESRLSQRSDFSASWTFGIKGTF